VLVFSDLEPTVSVKIPKEFRAGVEFDGVNGTATTPYAKSPVTFDELLTEAGLDPAEYEVVGNPRISKWQQRDGGDYLTSFRFTFTQKVGDLVDLPLLFSEAKKTRRSTPKTSGDNVFVIVPADYQVGKNASRGGTPELIQRVLESYDRIESKLKAGKWSRIVIVDAGDIVESVSNAASLAQLQSNDLSPMQQTDVAATLMWSLIKMAHKYAPVTYCSVGSNHCQWRFNGQTVGKPGLDDWGIVILQQLRRLSVEVGLDVTYIIPQPHDESVAFDPFGDGFHILAVAHGHQAKKPNSMQGWLEKQAFGNGPVSSFTTFISGHYHHLRVEELGPSHNGGSRYWVQASTSDNGSDWYRLTSGSESTTGITCFELQRGVHFQGTVFKL
jgi:hypothetical protein